MKKIIYFLFMLVFCMNVVQAQVPSYSFASSSGTYTENTAAATLLPTVRADTSISAAQNIGFTFNYAGTNYTQFLMSSNGFISFNLTAESLNGNDLALANTLSRPIIAPLWDDLDGATPLTSVASYEVTGVAPNRVLIVEWRNWEWNWLSNTPVISFQAKLYETTNVIQFVYRQEPTAVSNGTASIGIGSTTGTGLNTFLNVTTDAFPSVTSAVSVTTISVKPATGQTYTFTPTTCAAPVGLVLSNVLQQSATLTWTADVPAAIGYEYVVQPASALVLGAGTAVVANTVNIASLMQNTRYNVYLRKSCGSDFSSWVLAGSFTTLCNAQTEFVETFDSYPLTGTEFYADCWGKSNMTGNVYLTSGGAAPGSAPNRLFMSCLTTTTAVAVLPSVTNLQANTHRLVFKSYATATLKTIDVGYLTNPADIASFVVVQNLVLASAVAANATTQTVVPTGIPVGVTSLAFRITGSATTAYLDDVKWEPNTTCVEPTALVATGITTTTAQIDWTEPAIPAASGYDFFRSTSPITPLSSATPTGSVGAGLNSTILTGLVPSTIYYVWVRSRCTATETSPWSSILTFLTNCTDVTTFSQNFDAALSFPTCWKKLGAGGTGAIVANTAAVSLPNALSLSSTGTTVITQGLVIMPPVSNAGAGTHRLVFRARSTSTVGGIIQVGYVTDNFDGNTFVSVQTFTTTSITTFDSFSAILGSAPGANKFLAFRHAGAPANAVLIDNVSWEAIPSCLEPSALASSLVTNNSATISWTEPLVPAGLGYEYFLSTINTAPSAASVATGSVVAGISTLNLTALTAQTTHFVWVRSRCTVSDLSVWTPSITFTTACNPLASLPWSENFDTTATGTNIFPPCWGFENIVNTWAISTTPSPAFSGANLLRRTWSTNGWAFTPTMTLTAGTSYEFSYWMRANDTTAPGYSIDTAVGQSQSAAAMTTILDAKTGYVNAVWSKVTSTFVPTTTGIYTFGVRAGVPTSEPNGINFDDFRVQLTPSCLEPTATVASAVTNSTATVSWTAPAVAPANGYEYFLSTTNVAPSAASSASGSTAAGVTTVNLSPLLSSTTYFVWLRSVCSVSSSSGWTSSISFTTACVAESVPTVLQTVESTTGADLPICWSAQLITGTTNWIGYTPSGTFDENSTPVSGTRIFRKTWTNSDAVLFSNALSYVGVTLPTRVSLFLQRNTSADVSDQYKVFVNTTASLTGATQILTVSLLNTVAPAVADKGFYPYTANIPVSFHGQANVFVMIQGTTAGGSASYSLGIDDFKVETIPSCVPPTVLVASAITTTSATVSWTAPITAPANGYQYFLSTSNTAPAAASVATGSTVAGVTTVNLTPLLSATTYFIWVRSVCSASSSSSWSTALSFATACAPASMPYLENFESAVAPNLPNCSSSINSGLGNNWTVAANPGAGFTSNTLKYGWNSENDANTWFFTRAMNLTAGVQYKLNYRYGNNSATYVEKMKVAYGTAATVVGMTNPLADHTAITGGVPVTAPQVTFTPATTGVYFFGFHAYSVANQFDLYVDDIVIDTVLSNNTFDNSSFSYYPNPVKGILTLDYNQNISNVAVFNLLGQQVITKTVNANQSKIDMSNLSAGTYLVKVTADNQTKTIKVIKE